LNYGNTLRKLLFGSSLPQEYLCVGEELNSSLRIYLTGKDPSIRIDISASHIFLGYRPLVMAVVFRKSSMESEWLKLQQDVCFSFLPEDFSGEDRWRGFNTDPHAVARLALRIVRTMESGEYIVSILEGVHGEHRFLSAFHQSVYQLRELLKSRPGNVNLPGNLRDQVISAYAVPRLIRMITVREGAKMNMFPTDLHGPAGEEFYLSSLRIGGKANYQVESADAIALSKVGVGWHKSAYEYGGNHMTEMNSRTSFKLSVHESSQFGIPLPESVLSYRELKRSGSFDAGIHRIHTYEVVHEEKLAEGEGLAHIHRYYAQWRLNHQLPTKMYFR
jgi:hypothetical protein